MSVVVVYLDKDRPVRAAEFRKVAIRAAEELAGELHPLHTGRALLELSDRYPSRSVEQLIVCAHGGPDWLIHGTHGVRIARTNRGTHQVTVAELAEAWAPVLTERPLISLAACLCSRSPSWWLQSRFGRVLSTWGPRSYERGGEASFSARLRDMLCWHGVSPRVRGHMTSGHTTGNPILRQHHGPAASLGVPLFELALPRERPSTPARRRWVRIVRGRLAERWLMGDDRVVEEIAQLWAAPTG